MSKKLILVSFCILAMALGSFSSVFAGPLPGTGIVGSKHDMRSYDPDGDVANRVCAYCHTPHHAVEDLNADYMPLWSRTTTTQTFTGYNSTTLQSVLLGDPVMGPSRLCMSCHDGVVAIDAYYGSPGTVGMTEGDAFGEIGVAFERSLMNDHPIGFDYNAVAALDAEINPSSTQFIGGTKTIADVLYDDGAGNDVMTCATCHEVHNSPGAVDYWFLYGEQQDSNFCRTCHLK